ncbi:MAG: helix-turn-helix transcriptional regulator [Acidimicrobiales bacterium]|jgi:transcriptional regulator with XRE-family HTH domain
MKDPPRTESAQFVKELPERFNELGSFIREQRSTARLSLRRLSELAGISNPYLSQIERGLRRPSAEILQQIARALRISAETLYVQAGILEKPDGNTDLARHILADHNLTEDQKQALMRIYLSFRHENDDANATADADSGAVADRADRAGESGADRAGGSRVDSARSRADAARSHADGARSRADGAGSEVAAAPGGVGE